MGELLRIWRRLVGNITMRRVKIKCPWCGHKNIYGIAGESYWSCGCAYCGEWFDYYVNSKTAEKAYYKRNLYKRKNIGVIEEGNIWGLKTNLTIEHGTGSYYSSGGYWGDPYRHPELWKEEKQETFKPDREYCEHCHGLTKIDDRGNCCACGAPKGDKQ